ATPPIPPQHRHGIEVFCTDTIPSAACAFQPSGNFPCLGGAINAGRDAISCPSTEIENPIRSVALVPASLGTQARRFILVGQTSSPLPHHVASRGGRTRQRITSGVLAF